MRNTFLRAQQDAKPTVKCDIIKSTAERTAQRSLIHTPLTGVILEAGTQGLVSVRAQTHCPPMATSPTEVVAIVCVAVWLYMVALQPELKHYCSQFLAWFEMGQNSTLSTTLLYCFCGGKGDSSTACLHCDPNHPIFMILRRPRKYFLYFFFFIHCGILINSLQGYAY